MQEQSSKNRIIVEESHSKDEVLASITSYSLERKTKTTIVYKNYRMFLRNNSFIKDIPLGIIIKALGIKNDQELVTLVGTSSEFLEHMTFTMIDVCNEGI